MVEPGSSTLKLMARSDVNLFDSFQTGFTESMAVGKPSVAYFPSHLKPSDTLLSFSSFGPSTVFPRSEADLLDCLRFFYEDRHKNEAFQSDFARYRREWCGVGQPSLKVAVEALLQEP